MKPLTANAVKGMKLFSFRLMLPGLGREGGVLICPSSSYLDSMTLWRWVGACSTARQSIHRSAISGTSAICQLSHKHQWLQEESHCQQLSPNELREGRRAATASR